MLCRLVPLGARSTAAATAAARTRRTLNSARRSDHVHSNTCACNALLTSARSLHSRAILRTPASTTATLQQELQQQRSAATQPPTPPVFDAPAKSSGSTHADASKSDNKFNIRGTFQEGRSVYLDMQATTPTDPRVLDAMLPYMTQQYGNPHSRTHHFGWEAEHAIEEARAHVAAVIGADPKEIVFTSGATESNNAAIKGIAKFNQKKKKHLITLQTEHKCVLDSMRSLQQEGFDVTYLPVKKDGLVDMDLLAKTIRPDTSLVSIMYVNNEIGVIQPVDAIGKLCREKGVFFHTDAAQATGKIPIDVNKSNIDVLSISGHKIYGPKGVGALYVRRRPRVRLTPFISGGGQERNMRSGTLPTPLVVGLGEACRIAKEEMSSDLAHVTRLSKRLSDAVHARIKHVVTNGTEEAGARYPGNLNLSFAYVEGESLLMALKELAVSSGSACTSASLEPSYVLRALGVEEDMAHTSIRFGLGRFTTEQEVDHAVELLVKHVERLREMSPLYEMIQEGIDLKTIKWTD
jgi:cysteine desulfurase